MIRAMDIYGGSISIGWDVKREHVSWKEKYEDELPKEPNGYISEPGKLGDRGISILGMTSGKKGNDYGIAWLSEGKGTGSIVNDFGLLYINGQAKSGFKSFKSGDVIGCLIDQNHYPNSLYFTLNGKQTIPKIDKNDIEDNIITGDGIPLESDYELFPAICMYCANSSNPCSIRVNFAGPFKYPINGFEPIGLDSKQNS